MKNIFKLRLLAVVAVASLLVACKEEEFPASRPTFWPIITLNGDEFVRLQVGDEYTDPGAKATENGVEIPVSVGGDAVDLSTPGVYQVDYIAVNKDGISAATTRTVFVTEGPEAEGALDLEGTYKSTNATLTPANTGFYTSEVTKVFPSVYNMTNMYGATSFIANLLSINWYFFTTDGLAVIFPKYPIAGDYIYQRDGFDNSFNPANNLLSLYYQSPLFGANPYRTKFWVRP